VRKKVDLDAIVDALAFRPEEGCSFLDRETGEVHQLGSEELAFGGGEKPLLDLPDWQLPLVELARQILTGSSDRFVELPDDWDIHEYSAIERFASDQADPDVASELLAAISGHGAFRRFKDAVHRLGIADSWYSYRHDYLLEIARDWCRAHDVAY